MGGTPTRRQVLQGVVSAAGGWALSAEAVPGRAASNEAWPQFHYDTANSGYAPDNSGPIDNVHERWSFDTVGHVWSSPAVVEDTVYVTTQALPNTTGNPTSYVYALSADGGDERWSFETDEGIASSPAVVDDVVYFYHGGYGYANSVRALDATDGSELWRHRLDGTTRKGGWRSKYLDSSPAVVDGTVYVGSLDGNVYALDANDGRETWSFETDDFVNSSPAVADGTVYVGSQDNNVYALAANDGSGKWAFETDEAVDSSPAVSDGTVYVGSRDGNLYAIHAENGTERWSFETGARIVSSPAVTDDSVFVASWDGNLYSVDAGTGTTRWTFEMAGDRNDDRVVSSPVVVDDTVYIGYDDGSGIPAFSDDYVYAIDLSDGSQRWRFQLNNGDAVWSSPAVADGTVYVGSWPGKMYAVTGRTPAEARQLNLLVTALAAVGFVGAGVGWLWKRGVIDVVGWGPGGEPTGSGSTWAAAGSARSGGSTDGVSGGDRADEAADNTDRGFDAIDSIGSHDQSSTVDTVLGSIEASLEDGDELWTRAKDRRDAGETERALEAYDEALEAYRTALETADENDFRNTDEIDERIAAIVAERGEVNRQRLRAELDSLRIDLAHSVKLVESGNDEDARRSLADLESAVESLKLSAPRVEDHDIEDEITEIETRCEELRAELADRAIERAVPDEIPGAPDVAVDYDALTEVAHIGSGGNADVTRATLRTRDGDLTLAVKKPRMAGDRTLHAEAVERLLDEAETWEKLDDHDHVVGVVDWGSEPFPWIAMEYMDGGHLGKRAGEMDVPEALWTAIGVTKGVRHAHRRGIAHLDLKPENVLFRTVDGAWDVPKVGDWGLSKHLLGHSTSVDGMTVEYAAPEQFDAGYGDTDDITDVYQLGTVFYELFTGRPPFEGQPFEVIDKIKTKRPTPPSERADVPDGLDEVLLRALAKEKENRYDDIVYLRDDLQELFDEQ